MLVKLTAGRVGIGFDQSAGQIVTVSPGDGDRMIARGQAVAAAKGETAVRARGETADRKIKDRGRS
jgi:hypothetical protein